MMFQNVKTFHVKRFEIIERCYEFLDGKSEHLFEVYVDGAIKHRCKLYPQALRYLIDYVYKLDNKPYPLFYK